MLSKIPLPSSIAPTIVAKLESNKIKSAVSFATSVASPTTIPMSDFFRAGASFTPSPIIATTSPRAFRAETILLLC